MNPKWTPQYLRNFRLTHGLSQPQLASQLGTTQPKISDWENGKHRPSRLSCKELDRLERKLKRQLALMAD